MPIIGDLELFPKFDNITNILTIDVTNSTSNINFFDVYLSLNSNGNPVMVNSWAISTPSIFTNTGAGESHFEFIDPWGPGENLSIFATLSQSLTQDLNINMDFSGFSNTRPAIYSGEATVNPVPEAGTFILMILGLVFIAFIKKTPFFNKE